MLAVRRSGAGATDRAVARIVAMAEGFDRERIMFDRDHRRVMAAAALLPGASLTNYRVLEQRASAAAEGWDVALVPPLGPLPQIRFANGSDALDEEARGVVLLSAWAAARWNIATLAVPRLPQTVDEKPTLTERRGSAIAALLRERNIRAVPTPALGPEFTLVAAVLELQR